MKRLVLLMSIVSLTVSLDVCGGEPDTAKADTKRKAGEKPPAGSARASSAKDWYVGYLDKAVRLTSEQKKSMNRIIQARNKSMWEYQVRHAQRLKAAGNALVVAYRSMDGDVVAKAQRDYQELHAPLHQLMRQSQHALMQILTVEQKARLREFEIMKAIESMTAPVKLSDDQIRKIKAAWPKAGDYEAGVLFQQAVQRALTLDQKIAIAKHRAVAFVKTAFCHAELTAEQLKQAEAVAAKWAKNPSSKFEDFHKILRDKIQGLLTPEQKKAMKKPWSWNGGEPFGRRPPAHRGDKDSRGDKNK
jgi:Spy/CpxP family protein refolding chaperone